MLASLAVREPPDPDRRAAQKVAAARIDWKNLIPLLERVTRKLGASGEDAADLAHAAATKLLAGETSWDPDDDPGARRFLAGSVVGALANARRSARARREVLDGSLDDDAPHAAADALAVAAKEAQASAAIARLREALAQDATALAVVDLIVEGVGKPADQATRLSLPVTTVYDARERIARLTRRLAKEQAESQDAGESGR
jgi:DNA-directed RNA polymerase specialized sigma24 family protein